MIREKPKKTKSKTKTKPNCSYCKNFICQPWGKNGKSTFEPSNGGIGNKFNIIKNIFKYTIICNKVIKITLNEIKQPEKNLNINPKNKATIKFDKGPAIATLAEPYF